MVSERTDRGYRNDFAHWIRGGEAVPDEYSTMNCWEAVLISAFRAGVVDKSWLVKIHERAAAAAEQVSLSFQRRGLDAPIAADAYGTRMKMPYIAYGSSLMASLHSGALTRYASNDPNQAGRPAIPAGHIVFFDGLDHVALSIGTRDSHGRQQVLSLLDSPMNASSTGDESDESAIYGWMQVTSIEELTEYGDFAVIEVASPRWQAPPATGPPTPAAVTAGPARPLPTPPFAPHESVLERRYDDEDLVTFDFQLPAASSAVSGNSRWARINRSIPGVTRRPAISQETWTTHDDAAAAYANREQFIQRRFPVLPKLNPTGNTLNCSQALIAVDHMLNGVTTVRLPPATGNGGFYGMFRLKEKYRGEWVEVANYDDIIEAVGSVPGSRGAVYVGLPEGWGHVINVVDTSAGVVFLDGQAGTLAELWPDVDEIGLLLYHPRYPLLANSRTQQPGRQEVSLSVRTRDNRPPTPGGRRKIASHASGRTRPGAMPGSTSPRRPLPALPPVRDRRRPGAPSDLPTEVTGGRPWPPASDLIDWQESSHSPPPDPNGVKACVSIAIVSLPAGRGC